MIYLLTFMLTKSFSREKKSKNILLNTDRSCLRGKQRNKGANPMNKIKILRDDIDGTG